MKNKFTMVLMMLFILIWSNTIGQISNAQKQINIEGKVIDRDGNFVEGAQITLFPVKRIKGKFYPLEGDIIEFYESDKNGNFKIVNNSNSHKNFVMYVTNFIPEGYLAVIYPPFTSVLKSKYEGKYITFNDRKRLFLSNVPINVYYGKVEIEIRKPNNALFFQNVKSASLTYILKSVSNVIISEGTILGDSVFMKDSTFKLLLPEGNWKLDFEISDGNNLIKLSTYIDFVDALNTTKISLVAEE